MAAATEQVECSALAIEVAPVLEGIISQVRARLVCALYRLLARTLTAPSPSHPQVESGDLAKMCKRALEERDGLQTRLSELMEKITVLPGFYQQRIFLGDAAPDFFEALTAEDSGVQSGFGVW